jgi:hypothetical protein
MGSSPTTFHPFYNQLPHRAYTYFGRPKRFMRKHKGLPSPLGEEWYALLHFRKPKTSLGKSNPPCTPHFRNEKLRFGNIQQMVGKFFTTFDLFIYIFSELLTYIYIYI